MATKPTTGAPAEALISIIIALLIGSAPIAALLTTQGAGQ